MSSPLSDETTDGTPEAEKPAAHIWTEPRTRLRHDYTKYIDGHRHVIRRGVDFPADLRAESFRVALWNWCRRRKIEIYTSVVNNEEVHVECINPVTIGSRLPNHNKRLNALRNQLKRFFRENYPQDNVRRCDIVFNAIYQATRDNDEHDPNEQ
jgi:hypothetical protein